MQQDTELLSVEMLRNHLHAWECHIRQLGLDDRQRFIGWIVDVFDREDLGLLFDAEIDRNALWEVYLCDRYGG